MDIKANYPVHSRIYPDMDGQEVNLQPPPYPGPVYPPPPVFQGIFLEFKNFL